MRHKFVIFLLILTCLLGGAGFWYYQKQIFSKDVLKLEIFVPTKTGEPPAVNLLEEIEYIVQYENNGNVRLEDAKLTFEYPKYSITEKGPERETISLEDIYPGQKRSHSFKARLVGKEGDLKIARATLSYRPKNLQAFYESETTFPVLIKNVPLTFEFDLPSKVESGKEITFRLNYFSNVNFPLANLGIKIEYPQGFEVLEVKPESLDKKEWDLGLLNTTEGGRIEISGKLEGEVGENKVFQATLGQWREGEFVILKTASWGVEIIRPLLYIFQQIN